MFNTREGQRRRRTAPIPCARVPFLNGAAQHNRRSLGCSILSTRNEIRARKSGFMSRAVHAPCFFHGEATFCECAKSFVRIFPVFCGFPELGLLLSRGDLRRQLSARDASEEKDATNSQELTIFSQRGGHFGRECGLFPLCEIRDLGKCEWRNQCDCAG